MKTARAIAACATGVLLQLAATACAQNDDPGSPPAGPVKIGLITKFSGDFYDAIVNAVSKYDDMHADVEVVYGQGKNGTDDESAIGFIESMIGEHVNAIAITPTSPNVQTALDKATAAGIKIVLIDNDIPGWSGKSTVVSTDNMAGGRLAGTWLAGRLVPGASVAILQGRLGSPSLDDRVTGMKTELDGKVRMVAETSTDCDQTKGFKAVQDILVSHPDVSAIYSACGPPIIGAIKAVKAAKRQAKITLVGFDALPDEIAAIGSGDQAASVAQFPERMGTMGIQAAVDVARGQTVPTKIDTGVEIVTKDNVRKFQ